MNYITYFLVALVSFSCMGQALSNSREERKLPTVLKQGSRTTCRAALSECLVDIGSGMRNECKTLPIPVRAFVEQVAPGTFVVRKLRSGVWSYFDGAYFALILKKSSRLALVDFPDNIFSNTNSGSGTLLTTAIDQVLNDTVPTRIDIIYSHAHFDHIGGAARVFKYSQNKFPEARIFVWGTKETKDLIEAHTSNRAVPVNIIVKERGRALRLGSDLKVELMIVGGHTQQDLVLFIPKTGTEKGIVFYVDVVYPGWSVPFNLAITQDLRQMIAAQKEILKLDFDILVPGHIRIGTKRDIRVKVRYLEDLVETSMTVFNSIAPKRLAKAGIGKVEDSNAREFRNLFYPAVLARNLEMDACYRILIEKWGCKLPALDLFLRGHCFTGIAFVVTEL